MIEIRILDEDVDNGKPCADGCPVAIAATRRLGVPCSVYYSFYGERKKGWIVSRINKDKVGIVRLPTAVAVWSEAFDRTGTGKPFSFILEKKKEEK